MSHTLVYAPTALLRVAVHEADWIHPEFIDDYSVLPAAIPRRTTVLINHSTQSQLQLEQLIESISTMATDVRILVLLQSYSAHLARILYRQGASLCLASHVGIAVLPFLLKRWSAAESQEPITRIYTDSTQVQLHEGTGLLKIGDTQITLRRREAQVLGCLLKNHHRVVSRDAISQYIWEYPFEPAPTTLDVYVRRLRLSLGQFKDSIETARGFGYRINLAKLSQ